MTETANTPNIQAGIQTESLQTQQDDSLVWRALGHYAIGELSVGRSQNALYAYRLLDALEPFETRWKLGRAFCALNLRWLAEAQKILDAIAENDPPLTGAGFTDPGFTDSGQATLLRQCQERLVYLQRKSATPTLADHAEGSEPASVSKSDVSKDVGKVLRFPNAPRP